jgi:hypothetical protein
MRELRPATALEVVAGSGRMLLDRFFVSTRTADHHVSAVLRKLDVPTRGRAIKAAATIGIVPAGAWSLKPAGLGVDLDRVAAASAESKASDVPFDR